MKTLRKLWAALESYQEITSVYLHGSLFVLDEALLSHDVDAAGCLYPSWISGCDLFKYEHDWKYS